MLLQEILYKVAIRGVKGSTSAEITDVQIHSGKTGSGSVFIAVKGKAADGHKFIDQAIQNGARAVVCEIMPVAADEKTVYVQVENSAAAAALMAHNFFGRPSEKLKLVGVTGTNGKTTIATLLYKLFTRLGYTCGLISTVENRIGTMVQPATHTTPEAVSLNQLLRQMADEGCTHVFMETSSHALHQHRVDGLRYSGAIFSNITHDHLDYHGTFDEYIRVKKSFFDSLNPSAFACSNADDKRGSLMLQNTAAKKTFYSLKSMTDFKGKILDDGLNGLQMIINDTEVHFRLIGKFNASNLLAVFGAAICLGEKKQEVLTVLSELTGAPGRFEPVLSKQEQLMAIVDYAHTPDALLNVLAAVKKLKKGSEHVITVVGCGGDRDRTKRPMMAAAACAHSDRVIFTSDNPRSEDPGQIIQEMETGLAPAYKRKYISVPDRREAIKAAVSLAKPGDIILIAGKGHEQYQEIQGVKYHFDDKETVKDIFEQLNK